MRDVFRKIDAYYTTRLIEHGPTPRGVDWNSHESQVARFQRLARVIPQTGDVTVLDYGCGYGAFFEFLRHVNPNAAYIGYDVSDEMIRAAQQRCGDRAAFTSDRSSLHRVDVVVASGIFNVRMDVSPDVWERHVFDTLEHICSLAGSAFAFNMLTKYSDVDRMREDLYYADPHNVFDWCHKHYSRWIALLHDYGLYEFTILARTAPEVCE